jgi:nicotinamide-nucleotide amidase
LSAEIIIIGTELLHGLSRDTNSERIVEHLAEIGVEVHFKTTVGDDSARLAEAFRAASHRARYVVATGGLGATPDDITRKTIATVFRRRLVLDETVLDRMRARFRERGIEMPAINEAQALVPKGAKLIENLRGLAPGLHFAYMESDFFVLPGVPAEAEAMLEQYVVPFLRASRVGPQMGRRVIRTIGVSESALAERLQGFDAGEASVKVGYLPHTSGVDVTLAAASPDPVWLSETLDRLEGRVREIAGEAAYGSGRETLPEVLGTILAARKLTLATAESFTGGGLGAAITSIPGSSRYYLGGVVAYSNRAKEELLGVRGATLERHGAVSAEVVEEMAAGARERFGCDVALSTTGIAGPDGGAAEKPVGLVFLGLATREGTKSARYVFSGVRGEVASRSVYYALDLARRHLSLQPV